VPGLVALQSVDIAQKIASIQLWRQFQNRCIKWCREMFLPTVFQSAGYSHISGTFKTATKVIASSLRKCQLLHRRQLAKVSAITLEAVCQNASYFIQRQFVKMPGKIILRQFAKMSGKPF
jgi:hypothetical protein